MFLRKSTCFCKSKIKHFFAGVLPKRFALACKQSSTNRFADEKKRGSEVRVLRFYCFCKQNQQNRKTEFLAKNLLAKLFCRGGI